VPPNAGCAARRISQPENTEYRRNAKPRLAAPTTTSCCERCDALFALRQLADVCLAGKSPCWPSADDVNPVDNHKRQGAHYPWWNTCSATKRNSFLGRNPKLRYRMAVVHRRTPVSCTSKDSYFPQKQPYVTESTASNAMPPLRCGDKILFDDCYLAVLDRSGQREQPNDVGSRSPDVSCCTSLRVMVAYLVWTVRAALRR
jgi:hypothetical protein